jgi:3-oxoacyl-[acyl-carrier-protein] synthase II
VKKPGFLPLLFSRNFPKSETGFLSSRLFCLTGLVLSVEVVITGIGLISALGSLEMTWKRVLSGDSGIRIYQPFPELKPLPLALINNNIPIDLTNLIQSLVTDALQDANLTPPLLDFGVVIGSSRGYQAQLEQLARKTLVTDNLWGFSPISTHLLPVTYSQFIDYLPNRVAIATSQLIQSTGPILSPMAACATGIWTIAQGFELIKMGYCDQVIAGAVEAAITPLTIAGFQQMGALAKTGSYPFDRQREGFVLGEGGAVFILENHEIAQKRNAKIYGKILGFGLTNDANSITSPDVGGKTALRAITDCLERSQIAPDEIDYIHAHGTGTILNDQHEALLIKHLFPSNIAVSSTKGATGHTLGASGALGVAFGLMSLTQQILPPCVGLSQSDFELNLVRKPRKTQIKNVLCLSFGFGGQNAAIALSKSPSTVSLF